MGGGVRRLFEKFRAILGTSALGGFVGGVFGSAMLGVAATSGEFGLGFFAFGVAVSAGVGAVIGGGFGTLLALSPRSSLEELGVARGALLGAVAGAAFPLAAAILTGGWLVPLIPQQVALLGAVFGAAGAVLSGGLVAVAKDADDSALEAGVDTALLEEGS